MEDLKYWPDVDIIIPTFNCDKKLKTCLENVKKQCYNGKYTITIIDSGSTDTTLYVASTFNCKVFVNDGMWVFGKNGARIFGEKVTNAKFIWVLDSDNYFFDSFSLQRMVYQLMTNSHVNIAVPLPVPSKIPIYKLNNYLSIQEGIKILSSVPIQEQSGKCIIVRELTYGMPNAVLIRRETLEAAGGYDKDTWLLTRLRERGLASAIIMTNVNFEHDQVLSSKDYLSKWERRLKMYYHQFRGNGNDYFNDAPLKNSMKKSTYNTFLKEVVQHPVIGIKLIKKKDLNGIYGLIFPFLLLSLFIRHPIMAIRVSKEFV